MKYNVLIYGSGGREHALADKILQSPLLNKLFLTLPNDGFKTLGEEITFINFEDLAKKCVQKSIDLVVIGPEAPLNQGIVDILNNFGINCIGVNKKWAQLESSKKFAKEFMIKHDIPTAKYYVVNSKEEIDSILSEFISPPVLKADGLAAGKGVHLSADMYDAKRTLEKFLDGKYGDASSCVVVEEKLEGDELSIISIFDGKKLLPFIPARDYKRLYDGQLGPNTGGMGAYCPVVLSNVQKNDLNKYLEKLEKALIKENANFSGIIYSGLMLTKDGIKVLEYNMRFGDPETQPLMCHLNSDLLEIFIMATQKKLSQVSLNWKDGITIAVVVASKGYPEKPKTGCLISGLRELSENYKAKIFYAGVKVNEDNLMISEGGRVFAVCKTGESIDLIRGDIYSIINKIDFKDKIYRTDIAEVLVEK